MCKRKRKEMRRRGEEEEQSNITFDLIVVLFARQIQIIQTKL
jgi:hypothetical protein